MTNLNNSYNKTKISIVKRVNMYLYTTAYFLHLIFHISKHIRGMIKNNVDLNVISYFKNNFKTLILVPNKMTFKLAIVTTLNLK